MVWGRYTLQGLPNAITFAGISFVTTDPAPITEFKLFGEVGKNVWIVPPLTAAVGKYVSIGDGTYSNIF